MRQLKGIELCQRPREKVCKEEFTEGNEISSHYDRRERDPKARLMCIEHFGCKCAICGFDFAKVYGEVGRNFIEVHHIILMSSTSAEHAVDPLNDLIPVCSNCYSILHRRSPKKQIASTEVVTIIILLTYLLTYSVENLFIQPPKTEVIIKKKRLRFLVTS
jgi:predicted HNH restriction endonuclease